MAESNATKTWVVTSGRPRKSHAALNGVTVPLDQVFDNGMRWPGDPAGGVDNNAGCTCSLSVNIPDGASAMDEAEFDRLYEAQQSSMTREQRDIHSVYEGGGARKVNSYLRGNYEDVFNEPMPAGSDIASQGFTYDEMVDGIKAVQKTQTFETDQTLYRGIKNRLFNDVKPGQEIVDNGFLSTTSDASRAEGFFAHEGQGVVMELRVPAGTHFSVGEWIEREFILPPGTKAVVAEISEDGSRMVLEVVSG